jgi:IMP dehydrogenase
MVSRFLSKIKEAGYAHTFEDLIILPGMAKVEPTEITLTSRVSRRIRVELPFVSSPMDTVTEAEMAIELARLGAVGVIHRNCSVEEQINMVRKVKRSESFIIRDVVTIEPEKTVGDAQVLMDIHEISGLPVVVGGKLVGIITGRDVRFTDHHLLVEEAMNKDVVVAHDGISPDDAVDIMRMHKIEKLPIVDNENRLIGLITYKDVRNRETHKGATRDKNGRLVVGAAISPFDSERATSLSKIADFLVMDVAHYHNLKIIEATKALLKRLDDCDIVVGNIGTKKAALDVAACLDRVDGFRVGMGGGSVCTTTQLTKAGSPTPFATAQVADAVEELGLDCPIIADGGIKGAGDVAMVLALGADAAMMGYVFAGCKESPGETSVIDGRMYKLHRGMGSASARQKRMALDRYQQPAKGIPEGTEAWVPFKGEVAGVVSELTHALKAAMGYAGAANIEELRKNGVIAVTSSAAHAKPADLVFRMS